MSNRSRGDRKVQSSLRQTDNNENMKQHTRLSRVNKEGQLAPLHIAPRFAAGCESSGYECVIASCSTVIFIIERARAPPAAIVHVAFCAVRGRNAPTPRNANKYTRRATSAGEMLTTTRLKFRVLNWFVAASTERRDETIFLAGCFFRRLLIRLSSVSRVCAI